MTIFHGEHSKDKVVDENIHLNNKFRHFVLPFVLAIIIVCVIATIIFVATKITDKTENDGLYDGIEWGTGCETIAKKYPDGNKAEDENAYVVMRDSYEDIEGLYVAVTFEFENDKLYKVTVLASPDSNDIEMTHNQVAEYLTSHFTELYGDPVPSDFIPVWKTSKSTVSILDFAPIGSLLMIEYQDINYQD